jgi:hypothetical protein
VTIAAVAFPQAARRRYRVRRAVTEAGSVVLGVVILIWSLTPIYNMFLIALDPEEGEIEFDGNLWPPEPSLEGFRAVITQEARYLEDFWHQFGNSLFIGLLTMLFDRADRVAGELRGEPDAAQQRRAAHLRSPAHLRDSGILPDCSVLSDHAQLRAVG